MSQFHILDVCRFVRSTSEYIFPMKRCCRMVCWCVMCNWTESRKCGAGEQKAAFLCRLVNHQPTVCTNWFLCFLVLLCTLASKLLSSASKTDQQTSDPVFVMTLVFMTAWHPGFMTFLTSFSGHFMTSENVVIFGPKTRLIQNQISIWIFNFPNFREQLS